MNSIHDFGNEHLYGALDGDKESLRWLFAARVAGWGKPYGHEEFMTVGLFSDIEQEIESHVAFSLVQAAVDIALEQQREADLVCALALLQSLVHATQTTEVPGALKAVFPGLVAKVNAIGGAGGSQLSELSAYYRNTL